MINLNLIPTIVTLNKLSFPEKVLFVVDRPGWLFRSISGLNKNTRYLNYYFSKDFPDFPDSLDSHQHFEGNFLICKNCNSHYFLGYDVYNNGRQPHYTLKDSFLTAPNTTGLTCSNSNVEIQVRCLIIRGILNVKKYLF